LQEGADKIDAIYDSFKDVKINDKGLVWNTDLLETLELENLLRKTIFIQFRQSRPSIVLWSASSQEALMQEMTSPIEMTKILCCIPILVSSTSIVEK